MPLVPASLTKGIKGVGSRLLNRPGKLWGGVREGIRKTKAARDWQLKHHLGFGNLMNAGFWGYTIGNDLANGESIGGALGTAAGFEGGSALVNRMIPKSKTGFKWGAARMLGGMAGGLAGSVAGNTIGNKVVPIGRLAKPMEETYGLPPQMQQQQQPPRTAAA